MDFQEYCAAYPPQTLSLKNGKDFTYRRHSHPDAAATVVLLTGGIGLSDLFFRHFDAFSKEFSVITFDYQIPFESNAELAEAIAELLDSFDERAWLVGQSFGGVVAQIIARLHPETVDGLVLSNTCSLSRDMSQTAHDSLLEMIERQRRLQKTLGPVPLPLLKRMMKTEVMKMFDDSPGSKSDARELCDIMAEQLDKPYAYHMVDLLANAETHIGMVREDFARWDDRVLLILSEDDKTFHPDCTSSLVEIMTNPTVVTDLEGGHLSLIVHPERYVELVTDYILQRD